MISPIDIQRMALRIERLVQTSRHGWHPADSLEFERCLPTGHDPQRRLPDPKILKTRTDVSGTEFQLWNQILLRMEGLMRDNDPRNPKRMLRDMARGKLPFGR